MKTFSMKFDDLNGEANNIGFSIPVYQLISAGGEAIWAGDPFKFVGGSACVGVGIGVDFLHATISLTETKAKFNLIDTAKSIWRTVIGWFGGNDK